MINLIFAFLCGCLYVVGLIFGLDYQQVSVLVCCWLWPIICTVSTIPILYVVVKNFFRCKMSLTKVFYSVMICVAFYYFMTYCMITSFGFDTYPNMDAATFEKCMTNLQEMANEYEISYEALNLLIYVVLFAAIIAFNIFLCWLLNKRAWLEEKLSKSKFIMAIEKYKVITIIPGLIILANFLAVVCFLWVMWKLADSNANVIEIPPAQLEWINSCYPDTDSIP